jgi:hypothetical protein
MCGSDLHNYRAPANPGGVVTGGIKRAAGVIAAHRWLAPALSQIPLRSKAMKKATLSDLETSFDVIEAICLVAEPDASNGRTEVDVTLLVEGPNSLRVKVSSKALARIVELAREALGDDGATDEDDEAA